MSCRWVEAIACRQPFGGQIASGFCRHGRGGRRESCRPCASATGSAGRPGSLRRLGRPRSKAPRNPGRLSSEWQGTRQQAQGDGARTRNVTAPRRLTSPRQRMNSPLQGRSDGPAGVLKLSRSRSTICWFREEGPLSPRCPAPDDHVTAWAVIACRCEASGRRVDLPASLPAVAGGSWFGFPADSRARAPGARGRQQPWPSTRRGLSA
jgi:hypothetical protein